MDISFDILITDIAPAFSLIQRAGRVLRLIEEFDKKDMGEVYILINNVEEQVKGVYDLEMTKTTLEALLTKRTENEKVEINWRLAENDKDKLDYLKLIISLENRINNIISSATNNTVIKQFLDLLTNIHLTPQKIIGQIDSLFAGSFIRSSTLIPVIVRVENIEECVMLSWPRFQKLLGEAKKLRFLYEVKEETKEIEIDKNDLEYEMALVSMRKVINKIRREEKEFDEDLSGYLNIIPKGFVIPEDFIGVEDRGGDKFYYVKLI